MDNNNNKYNSNNNPVNFQVQISSLITEKMH